MKVSSRRWQCRPCGQHCGRLRALQSEEHAVERVIGAVEVLRQRTQMRLVGRGIAGIGDDHEALVAEPGDDQVVEMPAVSVEQEGVFRLPGLKRARIERAGAVDERRRPRGRRLRNSFMCEMSNRPTCSRV
jgi:hypothetical protein